MPSTITADSETAQEGELPDGSDKPPLKDKSKLSSPPNPSLNGKKTTNNSLQRPAETKSSLTPTNSVPLPPPEGGAFEKEPGHTLLSLREHILSEKVHTKKGSVESPPSTPSPDASEKCWSPTQIPSRPEAPSRAASRAPSFSGGIAGDKIVPPANPKAPKKPASVHSDHEKHKFNLKDLLGNAPKLTRRSSQRSDGSGKKSDSDGKSAAGDSTASLTKKYGVCAKGAIGKGATSVVRLAHKWDRSEEKLYAVKEFRKRRKNESEKEYVKKLTAEFCISSTLHHTNIVETVDLVQDENHNWCEVMEFCPGGDLYAAIKKGGMSPSEVECSFKQILTGVAYLHSQGVAHRDIKPENLFFDTKGHLKIGDYGASTVYRLPWETTVHMSTGLCGSEPYIAPEQFLGKPYDARLVDIWACGVVYYCLHFQELPWRAAQSSDTLYSAYAAACASAQSVQSACPPTINNLSPRACRPVIRKMLEPNPKLRSPIEDVIKHPWIESIEVCHLVPKPSHVHVNAQQLAAAQHH